MVKTELIESLAKKSLMSSRQTRKKEGVVVDYVDRLMTLSNVEGTNFFLDNVFASKRLNLFVVKILVAKLLRANGGCLGVR